MKDKESSTETSKTSCRKNLKTAGIALVILVALMCIARCEGRQERDAQVVIEAEERIRVAVEKEAERAVEAIRHNAAYRGVRSMGYREEGGER